MFLAHAESKSVLCVFENSSKRTSLSLKTLRYRGSRISRKGLYLLIAARKYDMDNFQNPPRYVPQAEYCPFKF